MLKYLGLDGNEVDNVEFKKIEFQIIRMSIVLSKTNANFQGIHRIYSVPSMFFSNPRKQIWCQQAFVPRIA
jgi:hypothetical protein